jgi:AP-1 complex subunit gamma-1
MRQFVLTSLTKLYARPIVSDAQRERIASILERYSQSPELEIQQRAVEFDNLFNQREIVVGVLEQMPAPELKATVVGTGKPWLLSNA